MTRKRPPGGPRTRNGVTWTAAHRALGMDSIPALERLAAECGVTIRYKRLPLTDAEFATLQAAVELKRATRAARREARQNHHAALQESLSRDISQNQGSGE